MGARFPVHIVETLVGRAPEQVADGVGQDFGTRAVQGRIVRQTQRFGDLRLRPEFQQLHRGAVAGQEGALVIGEVVQRGIVVRTALESHLPEVQARGFVALHGVAVGQHAAEPLVVRPHPFEVAQRLARAQHALRKEGLHEEGAALHPRSLRGHAARHVAVFIHALQEVQRPVLHVFRLSLFDEPGAHEEAVPVPHLLVEARRDQVRIFQETLCRADDARRDAREFVGQLRQYSLKLRIGDFCPGLAARQAQRHGHHAQYYKSFHGSLPLTG